MDDADVEDSAVVVEHLVQDPVMADAISQEHILGAMDRLHEFAAWPRLLSE